ncbi:MAG: tetratricopeptide repeat protein, partial [Endomicrobia bacterium]|nr:tetratricopeptide repeat protein [Endomicrobiia bacterium]
QKLESEVVNKETQMELLQKEQTKTKETKFTDTPFIKNKTQQQVEQQQEITKKQISPEEKRLMEQYFALGQQKFKEGNYNAAIIYFKKVLEIEPNHTLSKINIERAKRMLQR